MKSGRLGIALIGGLITLALLLAVFGPKLVERTTKKLPSENSNEAPTVVTAKGMLESADDVELTSQVKATVARVLVDEGEIIHKGQLLLEFDKSRVDAQYRQAMAAIAAAEARNRESVAGYRPEDVSIAANARERYVAVYSQARDEYERQRRLFGKGAATQVDLNLAEERMHIAAGELAGSEANLAKYTKGLRKEQKDQVKADLERARADLMYVEGIIRDYWVYSPISGVVAERYKDAGEGVDIGSSLMRVLNPDTIRIRAELEETDIGRVREGQTVEVTVDAFRNKIFRGKVTKTFPTVQRKSQKSFDPTATFDINTQKIHISLEDYSGLQNGMTVTVHFK